MSSARELSAEFDVLEKLIEAELDQHVFLHIEPIDSQYYLEHGFSEKSQKAFPKSKYDMEESGKCLALGRYSACVFHLIRIVDAGLKRLAKFYNSEGKNPSWEEFLRPLRDKLNELKKIEIEKAQQLGTLLERITAIKEIRNPITHSDEKLNLDSMERIENKYSPDETRRHFANVKAFLDSLVAFIG